MSETLQKLRQTLETRQGNLWEWRRTNPYVDHPLEVLGFQRDPQVTPPKIREAVQQVAQRGEDGPLVSSRARELLMTPETRVFCELLRIPPVAVPKDEIEQVRRTAQESFGHAPELPPIDDVALRSGETLRRITETIAREEPRFEALPHVDLDGTSAPEIERQHFAGITFRQRARRDIP